jgi:hypothetical protein
MARNFTVKPTAELSAQLCRPGYGARRSRNMNRRRSIRRGYWRRRRRIGKEDEKYTERRNRRNIMGEGGEAVAGKE